MQAVVDCFKGQPNTSGITYRIDPGHSESAVNNSNLPGTQNWSEVAGFKNTDIILTNEQILKNLRSIGVMSRI